MTDFADEVIVELQAAKASLVSQIETLQRELKLTERMIMRREADRAARLSGKPLTRKNEERAITEGLIIDAVRASKKGLRTAQIFDALKRRDHVTVTYSTLRAYVTRLRDAGKIRKAGSSSYHWVVSN